MDSLYREKYENRFKIICFVIVREELINDMWYLNGKLSDVLILNDDVYFDWEISEGNFNRFEDKIKNFCDKLEKIVNNKDIFKVLFLKWFLI